MVTKQGGEQEPYDENKIRASATRVGVPENLQNQMISAVRSRLYDGINTNDIYTIIKSFLRESEAPYLASKYNLKNALSQLGPSGYPFEQYVAKLLTAKGYKTTTNEIWQGQCVTHEIDVVAKKDNHTYLIEAKFHSSPNQRTDVRITLYIRARYEDLAANWKGSGELMPWIVTNTRFSTDALKYARCRDIKVTSWGFPEGQGIMDLIESTRLHPLTILESLTDGEKRELIALGAITCTDLLTPRFASTIREVKRSHVLAEVNGICQATSSVANE